MSSLETSVLRAVERRYLPPKPTLFSTLLWPIVLSVLAAFFAISILLLGVPQLLPIYKTLNIPTPLSLQFLVELSAILGSYGWMLAAVCIAAGIIGFAYRASMTNFVIHNDPIFGAALLEDVQISVLTSLTKEYAEPRSYATILENLGNDLRPPFSTLAVLAYNQVYNEGVPAYRALAEVHLIAREDEWALEDADKFGKTEDTLHRLIHKHKLALGRRIHYTTRLAWIGTAVCVAGAALLWLMERYALIAAWNAAAKFH